MKSVLAFGLMLLSHFAFTQELIENFDEMPDSTRGQKVLLLLMENARDTSLSRQVEGIKEIADFCRQHDAIRPEAVCVLRLYALYIDWGKYAEAEKVAQLIDDVYYQHLIPLNQHNYNVYQAEPLIAQGKFDEALAIGYRTLELCEENNLSKRTVYGLLSTVHFALGQLEKALEIDKDNLTEIIGTEGRLLDRQGIGQACYSISRDFAALEQLDSSLVYAEMSTQFWDHPISYGQITDIYLKKGDLINARKNLTIMDNNVKSFRVRSLESIVNIYYARLETMEKNWDAAIRYSEKALTGSLATKDVVSIRGGYELLIRSLLKDKSHYLDSLLGYDETLTNNEIAELTIEMATKYETAEKEKEILTLNGKVKDEAIEKLRFRTYLLYTAIIAVVTLALVFFIFRLRRIRTEREIESLRRQALQLQMNPHFFFNSLNSIHNFIALNNTQEAKKYLVNFSKLMRLTLENSKEDLVTIRNEVAFLNEFLTLEQLRSKNFTFTVEADEALLEHKIPVLLIQPLIENSLLHGFPSADYKGEIAVKITREKDMIRISVKDNGVGKANSMAAKKEEAKEHTVHAIDILKRRVAIYGHSDSQVVFSEGIANGEYPGTGVSFLLSLI